MRFFVKKHYLMEQSLRKPFYSGTIVYTKNYKSKNPKILQYSHNYETLISESLFEKCKAVMDKRNSRKNSQTKYRGKDFLFRGLVRCGNCGYLITNDEKVKPSGKRYVYLTCSKTKNHCGKSKINEKKALEKVEDVFKNFKLPDSILAEMKGHLKSSLYAKTEFRNRELGRLDGMKTKIRNKKDALLDAKLEGDIDKATYEKKKQQFNDEFERVSHKISNYDRADEQFSITLNLLLDLATNAYELFKSSKLEQKRRLLAIVFSNFVLTDVSLCFSLRKPFDAMVKLAKSPKWRRVRDSNSR